MGFNFFQFYSAVLIVDCVWRKEKAMIIFSEDARKSMIALLTKERKKIEDLEDKRDAAQAKFRAIELAVEEANDRQDAIMEAYGITYNYIKGVFELDPDYVIEDKEVPE